MPTMGGSVNAMLACPKHKAKLYPDSTMPCSHHKTASLVQLIFEKEQRPRHLVVPKTPYSVCAPAYLSARSLCLQRIGILKELNEPLHARLAVPASSTRSLRLGLFTVLNHRLLDVEGLDQVLPCRHVDRKDRLAPHCAVV